MQNRPIIGVCASSNAQDRLFVVRQNYMQSVLDAGGLPVLLPQVQTQEEAAAYLDHLDGLLLAGGVDVDPAHYGEAKHPACGEIDARRDAFELAITPLAVARHMPIFGICRGIQMLCVAMGGTLVQDIEAQLGIPRTVHQQAAPYDAPVHAVHFTPGGWFASVTGVQTLTVNSMHHQAVKDAGPHLRVEGLSEDGVIEAVIGAQDEHIFAVQFHPEYLAAQDDRCARLFARHVQLAAQYRAQR